MYSTASKFNTGMVIMACLCEISERTINFEESKNLKKND